MNVLHWILNPATTQISEEELAKIANAQSKLINIARQTRQLRVNVTQKLDGLNVAFQLEHSNGNNANITHERSPWVTVKLGADPEIVLNKSKATTNNSEVNFKICGNVSGIPPPAVTIISPLSNNTIIPESLYVKNGNCWTFNNSIRQLGHKFIMIASNCLSSASTPFLIEVKPTIHINIQKSNGCFYQGCKEPVLVGYVHQNIAIPITISEFPSSMITWTKFKDENKENVELKNLVIQRNHTHMILKDTKSSNSGWYRVKANNTYETSERTFQLVIIEDKNLVVKCDSANFTKKICALQESLNSNNLFSNVPYNLPHSTTPTDEWMILKGNTQQVHEKVSPTSNFQNVTESNPAAKLPTEMTAGTAKSGNSNIDRDIPIWLIGAACSVFGIMAICIIVLSCHLVKQRARKIASMKDAVKAQPKWANENFMVEETNPALEQIPPQIPKSQTSPPSCEKRIERQIRKGRKVRFTAGEAMSQRQCPTYSKLWPTNSSPKSPMAPKKTTNEPQYDTICEASSSNKFKINLEHIDTPERNSEYPELEFVYTTL
ncbi:uncharacterized protein LOC134176818 isoform X2 [Corticium candelabrum]|nr:uncharacterized protein LOC134176818 isoform X2 [Corticium candelabrum]